MNHILATIVLSVFVSNSLFASALATSVLSKNTTSSPQAVEAEEMKVEDSVPGQIIVKFKTTGKNSLTKTPTALLSSKATFKSATTDKSGSLDSLAAKYKVRTSKAFLRTDATKAIARASQGLDKKREKRANQAKYTSALKSLSDVSILSIDKAITPETACAEFRKDPHVEYCQPNYKVSVQMIPNDPYFSTSGAWGQTYPDMWGLKTLDAEKAWDTTQGEGTIVAVVDTGVDYNHPDLAANMWKNAGEIPGNGIDDDANGYVDDVQGWNFVGENNNPMDDFGHGTHVSGTIAAVGNNNLGIIGVAPKAKIMAVKGLNQNGSGTFESLANALLYAAQNGADVINNSWGCGSACPSNPIIEDAVRAAYALGSVVVFAAGNSNMDVSNVSPQNMTDSKPIVVGASDENNVKVYFSNYGALVDVSAPGGGAKLAANAGSRNILSLKSSTCNPNMCPASLLVGDKYVRQAGTSMATPHVAGLMALLVSKYSNYTIPDLKKLLFGNVTPVSSPVPLGTGVVNANNSVDSSSDFVIANITSPVSLSSFPSSNATVVISGNAYAKTSSSYSLSTGMGDNPTSWQTTGISSTGGQVLNGRLGVWVPSSPGLQVIRLLVTNAGGVTKESRVMVNVVVGPGDGWPFALARPEFFSGKMVTSPLLFKDIDGDGKQEMVFTVTNPEAGAYGLIYALRSDGSFLPNFPIKVVDQILADSNYGGLPAVGNLDNDPTDNEIATFSGAQIHVYKKDGSEVAGWPKPFGFIFNGTNYVGGVTLADLDGDGSLEVIFPELVKNLKGSQVSVYHKDGTVMQGFPKHMDYNSYTRVSVADLDGDGKLELVAAAYNNFQNGNVGYLYAWHGDGSSVSGFPVQIAGTQSTSENDPVIGDVDGDGKNDIVVNYGLFDTVMGRSSIAVFDGQGKMKPGWPQEATTFPSHKDDNSLVLGDLDNDGVLDIILQGRHLCVSCGRNVQNIHAFKGNGQELPGWPVELETLLGARADVSGLVIADINGDGKKEVLINATTPSSSGSGLTSKFLALDNNGKLIPGLSYNLPDGLGLALGLGDMDSSGTLEAVGLTSVPGFINVAKWNIPGQYKPSALEWPVGGQNSQYTSAVTLFKNSPPTLSPVPSRITSVGKVVSFSLNGNDPDGNQIVYQALNPLPEGAILASGLLTDINHDGIVDAADVELVTSAVGTPNPKYDINVDSLVDLRDVALIRVDLTKTTPTPGTFTWTPTQTGTTNLSFLVSDGVATSTVVTTTVSVSAATTNHAPIMDPIPLQFVVAGQNVSFTINATDADGDIILYKALNLPSGAAFSTSTRVFSWTPALTQIGKFTPGFMASDDFASVSESKRSSRSAIITVTAPLTNVAPTVAAVPSKSAISGQKVEFTLNASDPDGDPLTYSASNLPTGSSFNVKTGVFSWTPSITRLAKYTNGKYTLLPVGSPFNSTTKVMSTDQAGKYTITLSVSDGKHTVSKQVSIIIGKNPDSPALPQQFGEQ